MEERAAIGFHPHMHFNEAPQPPADWNEIPLAVKPDGTLLYEYSLLPRLGIPQRIVVGRDHLEIDGWIFAYHLTSRAVLKWMQEIFRSWREQDPSDEFRDWLDAMVQTLCDRQRESSERRKSGAG